MGISVACPEIAAAVFYVGGWLVRFRACRGGQMVDDSGLRADLVKLLASPDAHASFDAAVKEFPAKFRGVVPERWEYSAWQLVEHIRIAQADILEFSVGA